MIMPVPATAMSRRISSLLAWTRGRMRAKLMACQVGQHPVVTAGKIAVAQRCMTGELGRMQRTALPFEVLRRRGGGFRHRASAFRGRASTDRRWRPCRDPHHERHMSDIDRGVTAGHFHLVCRARYTARPRGSYLRTKLPPLIVQVVVHIPTGSLLSGNQQSSA